MSKETRENNAQKLAAMFSTAKKNVQLGEKYALQAKSIYESTIINTPRLQIAKGRLIEIQIALVAQKETLIFLFSSFESKNRELNDLIQVYDKEMLAIEKSFEECFVHLKATPFQNKNSLLDSEISCLYDFVDDTSVNTLLERAQHLINELKKAKSHLENLYETAAEKMKVVQTTITDFTIKEPVVDTTELTAKSLSLSTVSVSIVAHFDRISYALQTLLEKKNMGASMTVSMDIVNVHERHHKEAENCIFDIYEQVTNLENQSDQLEYELDGCLSSYHKAIEIFSELDACSKSLYFSVRDFSALENSLGKGTEEINTALAECRQLADWYVKFGEAYSHLQNENERRSQINSEYQALVKDCQEKLNNVWESEKQKRIQFNSSYGIYLPPGFEPILSQQLPRSQIIQDHSYRSGTSTMDTMHQDF